MAKTNPDRPVQLSVLDRLLDNDPSNRREAPLTRSQSVHELKAAIRRDLEWLLNTRSCIQQPKGSDETDFELVESVYNYGVPDMTNLCLSSVRDRRQLSHLIEQAIANYEPRLQGVHVVTQPVERDQRQLRFVIEGMLQIEPSPELVSFDTFVEMGSGECRIKGE
jgi:type VI secretion system protein ImpF